MPVRPGITVNRDAATFYRLEDERYWNHIIVRKGLEREKEREREWLEQSKFESNTPNLQRLHTINPPNR